MNIDYRCADCQHKFMISVTDDEMNLSRVAFIKHDTHTVQRRHPNGTKAASRMAGVIDGS